MLSLMSIAHKSRKLILLQGPATFSVDYLNKRNAGHSEAANRKSVKEAANKKRVALTEKFRKEIYKEVSTSKNANLERSSRLQSILTEARKSNISTEGLQKYIKSLSSLLNKENVKAYIYKNSLGIVAIVEISVVRGFHTAITVENSFKKLGFKCLGLNEERFRYLGIIDCKPSENVKKNFEEALEDAITANCEEVRNKDDGQFQFTCSELELDDCKNILEGLGYKIVKAEKTYDFKKYVSVPAAVMENLKHIESRFMGICGFVKLSHNVINK